MLWTAWRPMDFLESKPYLQWFHCISPWPNSYWYQISLLINSWICMNEIGLYRPMYINIDNFMVEAYYDRYSEEISSHEHLKIPNALEPVWKSRWRSCNQMCSLSQQSVGSTLLPMGLTIIAWNATIIVQGMEFSDTGLISVFCRNAINCVMFMHFMTESDWYCSASQKFLTIALNIFSSKSVTEIHLNFHVSAL